MKSKLLGFFLVPLLAQPKELALSFDDSPEGHTSFFESQERTDELIKKLKQLDVPPVMVFAVPCRRPKDPSTISQLKKFKEAGHIIASHTCTHPRYDDTAFSAYAADAQKADRLLAPLMSGQKFFRFPFLNEGESEKHRNEMRSWLKENQYRNGYVSIDNDDYIYTLKMNQARKAKKKIDFKKVETHFINHITGAAQFFDDLAVKTLGRSPKHVLLLHEKDATVLFIESLVKELRQQGWKIISAEEAYKDKVYLEQPKNTFANNGIIAQIAMEKTGEKIRYGDFDELKSEINAILDLHFPKE